MRNTQVHTAGREAPLPYTVSADFEKSIREQLNQICLTEQEENACILATD